MDGSLVGVLDVRVLVCAECGGERPFEQPPCLDGHEACAEWACTECGFAVFLDPGRPDQDRAFVPVSSPVAEDRRGAHDVRPHAA